MKNIAIVFGGAKSSMEEFGALPENVRNNADIWCCNDVGTVLPKVDYWCSLHPDQFADNNPKWISRREQNNLSCEGITFVGYAMDENHREATHVDIWSNEYADGSSGMFAVGQAFASGRYSAIICCGIPMDSTVNPYLKRPSFPTNKAVMYYKKAWTNNAKKFRGIVFSQGGWTKELLGAYEEDKSAAAGNKVSE